MTHRDGARAERHSKRSGLKGLKRRLRLYYLRILRIDDPPERIARGAAIGVFMGVFPTFGVGTIVSFGLAFVFRANKAAAVIGTVIANPLTAPFFWTASAVVGAALTGSDYKAISEEVRNISVVNGLGRAAYVYLIGNTIISTVAAAFSYHAVKYVVVRHRARKAARKAASAKG